MLTDKAVTFVTTLFRIISYGVGLVKHNRQCDISHIEPKQPCATMVKAIIAMAQNYLFGMAPRLVQKPHRQSAKSPQNLRQQLQLLFKNHYSTFLTWDQNLILYE